MGREDPGMSENLSDNPLRGCYLFTSVVELFTVFAIWMWPAGMVDSEGDYSMHCALTTSIAYAVFVFRARALEPDSDAQPMVGFSLLIHHGLRICVSLYWLRLLRAVIDLVQLVALFIAARQMADRPPPSPQKIA